MSSHASGAGTFGADGSDAELRTIPVVGAHLDAIRALCREFGVARLEVFGSVMTARFDPVHSDVDYLVSYPDNYDVGPLYRRHFALQRALADVIGHGVELVEASAQLDPLFAAVASETRSLVYDASLSPAVAL